MQNTVGAAFKNVISSPCGFLDSARFRFIGLALRNKARGGRYHRVHRRVIGVGATSALNLRWAFSCHGLERNVGRPGARTRNAVMIVNQVI